MEDSYLYGGADPLALDFQQPKSVRSAVNSASGEAIPLTPEQRELDAKLAALGLQITNFAYPTCPTGPQQWIRTNSAWPECEKKLGLRWRTPEGWCYPEGMCAIDDADKETKKLTQYRKIELFQRITGMLNAVRSGQREEWLLKKAKEMRSNGRKLRLTPSKQEANGDYVDNGSRSTQPVDVPPYDQMGPSARQEFEDAVKAEMPAHLRDLPTAAILKDQQEKYSQLQAIAKTKTEDVRKKAQVRKLIQAMQDADVALPAGMDWETYATKYYDTAVSCADKSIGHTIDEAIRGCESPKDASGDPLCTFYELGETCMPKNLVSSRSAKWERGEEDPMGGWWHDFFEERERTQTAKSAKVQRVLGAPSARRRVL